MDIKMRFTNEKFCISFYDDLRFLEYDKNFQKNDDIENKEILENRIVYNKFMDKVLSCSSVTSIRNVDLWKGIGCIAMYAFDGETFLVTSARWDDRWEITLSLGKYPNLFSKIVNKHSYLIQIQKLKNFSEIIFNAIKSEINSIEISVFLTTSPNNEVNDISLLKWE